VNVDLSRRALVRSSRRARDVRRIEALEGRRAIAVKTRDETT
jgi:hypothetical protein